MCARVCYVHTHVTFYKYIYYVIITGIIIISRSLHTLKLRSDTLVVNQIYINAIWLNEIITLVYEKYIFLIILN